MRRLFLTVTIALYCLPTAMAAPSTAVEQGRRIFAQSCIGCHDAHSTQRLAGPGLKDYFRSHRPQPTDVAVRTVIQRGRGAMPAFSQLSAAQLTSLVAYLRTL
jgi:mono/diheme cytochrome c family protein